MTEKICEGCGRPFPLTTKGAAGRFCSRDCYERPRLQGRKAYAPRDGHRPSAEEQWHCPNCGRLAKTYVSFRRVIACKHCSLTTEVNVRKVSLDSNEDLDTLARCDAEQVEAAYWKTGE